MKGTLVSVNSDNPVPSAITFQYNPDTLARTFQSQGASEGGERSEAYLLKGPPAETIRLEAEIDATDPLEQAEPNAARIGIQPQLASLFYSGNNLVMADSLCGSWKPLRPSFPLGH